MAVEEVVEVEKETNPTRREVVAEVRQTAQAPARDVRMEADKDAEIARLKGELDVLRDEVARERARNLIERAKIDGKLTPAMLGEGSAWVEMAYNHPELFVRLVETLPKQMAASEMVKITVPGRERDRYSRAGALAREIAEKEGIDFAAAYDAVFARRLLED